MERVDDKRRLCLAQCLEINELFDCELQIVFAQIDFFARADFDAPVWRGRNTTFGGAPGGPSFGYPW